MPLDGDCPKCGSGDYHRDGDRVQCNDCGFTYDNIVRN